MEGFIEQLVEQGWRLELAIAISKFTNSVEEAYSILDQKKEIIEKIVEFGMPEEFAEIQSLGFSTAEEAMSWFYRTIPKKSTNMPGKAQKNNAPLRPAPQAFSRNIGEEDENSIIYNLDASEIQYLQAGVLEIPSDSLQSIYFAPEGTEIPGKKFNPITRDDFIQYANENYWISPLSAEKKKLLNVSTLPDLNLPQDPCAICQEAYNANEEIISLPCGDFFHRLCIETFFNRKDFCPVCLIKPYT